MVASNGNDKSKNERVVKIKGSDIDKYVKSFCLGELDQEVGGEVLGCVFHVFTFAAFAQATNKELTLLEAVERVCRFLDSPGVVAAFGIICNLEDLGKEL